jgi:hypothetical protein
MRSSRRKPLEFVTTPSGPVLKLESERRRELDKVLSGVPEPAWDRDADIKAQPHGTDKVRVYCHEGTREIFNLSER